MELEELDDELLEELDEELDELLGRLGVVEEDGASPPPPPPLHPVRSTAARGIQIHKLFFMYKPP